MKKENNKKKISAGYILLIIYSFLLLTCQIVLFIIEKNIFGYNTTIRIVAHVVLFIYLILSCVAIAFCRTKKWAGILCVVMGLTFGPFGIIAILGGALCMKDIEVANQKRLVEENQNLRNNTDSKNVFTDTNTAANIKYLNFKEYLAANPIDYETKPNIAPAFDPNSREHLHLTDQSGQPIEVAQLYLKIIDDKVYLLTRVVSPTGEDTDEQLTLYIDYENDSFLMSNDDSIIWSITKSYYNVDSKTTNTAEDVKKNKSDNKQDKLEKIKLDLHDISIDEKTWKDYKKTASEEELAILAIGTKYRLSNLKRRILNAVSFIAMILCFALIPVTTFQSLIAYPFIAFFATKTIRYTDTYNQTYSKISKENRYLVDDYFNENTLLNIFDLIIYLGMFFITLPYQALMIGIGMFAPNFAISKNGVLVSIPNGYDISDLEAVGEYYRSFNFAEEFTESITKYNNSSSSSPSSDDTYYKQDEYTYTDSFGYEQTAYSQNGKDFYDDGGKYIGSDGDKFKVKKWSKVQ